LGAVSDAFRGEADRAFERLDQAAASKDSDLVAAIELKMTLPK
jgi:hypothetical protein